MIFGRLKSCTVMSCLARRAAGCHCNSVNGCLFIGRGISEKKHLSKPKRLESVANEIKPPAY
jgi:hypothetical protein